MGQTAVTVFAPDEAAGVVCVFGGVDSPNVPVPYYPYFQVYFVH